MPTGIRYIDASYETTSGEFPADLPPPNPVKLNRKVALEYSRTDPGPVIGYKQLIRRVQDATSALSGYRTNIQLNPGHYDVRVTRVLAGKLYRTYQSRSGDLVDPTVPAFPSSTGEAEATNQALTAFSRNYIKTQQAFQSFVALGELHETLSMLRNPAKALTRGVGSYFDTLKKRRRRGQSSRQRKRILQDTWLEYSFGWVPLINDIKDAQEALSRLSEHVLETTSVRGYAQYANSTTVTTWSQIIGNLRLYFVERYQPSVTVVYRGIAAIEASTSAYAAQQFGITFRDFVPSAWELIPYSFLVDYFTNVGDVISAYSYGYGNLRWWNKVAVFKNESFKTLTTVELLPIVLPYSKDYFDWSPGSAVSTYSRFARIKGVGNPMPSLAWKIPDFFGRDWKKALNLGALFSTHRSLTPYY